MITIRFPWPILVPLVGLGGLYGLHLLGSVDTPFHFLFGCILIIGTPLSILTYIEMEEQKEKKAKEEKKFNPYLYTRMHKITFPKQDKSRPE